MSKAGSGSSKSDRKPPAKGKGRSPGLVKPPKPKIDPRPGVGPAKKEQDQ